MQENDKLELIRASEITEKEVEWLWYPYIPLAKLTLLQGDPGTGKSSFMMTLAALLTQGQPMPFADEAKLPPVTVIYQTTEDDADDTVVPRFRKAGGDRQRLIFIRENKKTLTFSDSRIGQAIRQTQAKLFILDPMSAYIGNVVSMNSANDIRAQFNPLIQTARDTGCAIVIVAHMNKKSDMKALYRTVGSIDVVGAVRSALMLSSPDGDRSPKRILTQTKNNLAEKGMAITFNMVDSIEWLEQTDTTADEVLGVPGSGRGRPDNQTQAALVLIARALADGPKPSGEMAAAIKAADISQRTSDTARAQLGVKAVKKGGLWYWQMPP